MASVTTKTKDSAKATKRTSRPSIRHSLNLASMGKALVDVINKDGKEVKDQPPSKKDSVRRASTSSMGSKDMAARRASTISIGLGRPTKPLDTLVEGEANPTAASSHSTITQAKRTSGTLQKTNKTSIDENGAKVAPSAANAIPPQTAIRTVSSLRPRKTAGTSSLPKYRPKSVIVEGTPKESISAFRISRKIHSCSDEEKDLQSISTSDHIFMPSLKDKGKRPISPIPHRSSRTSTSSSVSSISSFKPPQPTKDKKHVSATSTPPRPKKIPLTSSPAVSKTGLPRPSSATTNTPKSSSDSPRTPTSIRSAASRLLGGRKDGRESPSPLRSSTTSNVSFLAKKGGKKLPPAKETESNQNTPTAADVPRMPCPADMSFDDIESILAAAASPSSLAVSKLGASIRFDLPDANYRGPLHQHSVLELSLPPPSPQSSLPSSRRPSPSKRTPAERTSIANWQALADLSLEINADELQGGLITELDLPSTPAGLMSPSPSMMRVESDELRSPTPLSLSSPSKYSSISQMLLPPNATPSPSHQNNILNSSFSSNYDNTPTMDSATVTLLKLQLTSVENLARERLSQISRLEDQLSSLKEARKRDEHQLILHVNELEEKLHETLAARERERLTASSYAGSDTSESESECDDDEHTICRSVLEDRVKQVETERQQAISDALAKLAERERAERAWVLQESEKRQRLALVTRDAQQQWAAVKEVAQSELEVIRANKDTLAILRASLDFFEAQVHISSRVRIPPSTAAKFHLA